MNVGRRQVATDPHTKPNDRLWVRLYAARVFTHHAIYFYYYSAWKLILILPSRGG